jgi:hypothetical protein
LSFFFFFFFFFCAPTNAIMCGWLVRLNRAGVHVVTARLANGDMTHTLVDARSDGKFTVARDTAPSIVADTVRHALELLAYIEPPENLYQSAPDVGLLAAEQAYAAAPDPQLLWKRDSSSSSLKKHKKRRHKHKHKSSSSSNRSLAQSTDARIEFAPIAATGGAAHASSDSDFETESDEGQGDAQAQAPRGQAPRRPSALSTQQDRSGDGYVDVELAQVGQQPQSYAVVPATHMIARATPSPSPSSQSARDGYSFLPVNTTDTKSSSNLSGRSTNAQYQPGPARR